MKHQGIDSRAQGQLEAFAELVRRWSQRLDLISPADLERFEERHVADSLRLAPLLDELLEGPCVDVGSGAGLPGVPLAVARPNRSWRLIEPRRRRAAFLEEVVRELDLKCEVVVATAAEAALIPPLARGHALATARAVVRPPAAFRELMPLVAPGGLGAVFVGRAGALPRESKEWAPGIAIMRATE